MKYIVCEKPGQFLLKEKDAPQVGEYVLVGLSKGELAFQHPAIHAKETTLMCSRNATMKDFKLVIDILRTGQFPADAFVTHTVAFEEMIAHFDGWLDSEAGVIKAIVTL
ncbi:MAG: hypothetical protein DHS20C18_23450 [Saprospiraceae bacterium]|nr:MAG: hypothetical protein DHS20C18_23450 [Saprospiraceae bacterium]